jgi:Domain of unknown function (DUF4386)
MLGPIADMSPRVKARIAGLFYLLTMLAAAFSQGFVTEKFVILGDAAATAANILAHEDLFRIAFAVYFIEMSCLMITTVLFYDLLKPVSKSLSLLAAVFGLTGCIIKTMSRLFFITPLLVLGGSHYLNVFSPEQLQAQALLFLNINDLGAGMALVFFGIAAPLKGYLIIRSTFLPRILGVLGILGGVGWLSFLYTPLAHSLFPYIIPIGLLGSVAQIVWLLVFGVNEQRWKEQAGMAG